MGKHPGTHWEVCEIFCALLSSLITSAYTLHHNENHGISLSKFEQQILAFDLGHFSFILDPPPAMFLVFCLVLGCSVASFTYRRHQDEFQTPIFLLITIATISMGWALGKNANLIMLGLIPWGLCFAMAFSCILHWLLERRRRRIGYV
ncbi:hypothetical protein DL98DRAFT_474843 [Cadophora sp. DSE1049]|nr:hypothetical protein DL98DRAFT_474843 [Cadophora sp. DSE1049]